MGCGWLWGFLPGTEGGGLEAGCWTLVQAAGVGLRESHRVERPSGQDLSQPGLLGGSGRGVHLVRGGARCSLWF